MGRRRSTTRIGHTHGQRGFALPLVVLLTLVGGLAIALLLERHSVQALAYQRQVENYTNHHESSGIMECILNWLPTTRGRLETAVDENNLAFSMDLSGGPGGIKAPARLDVYMRDGQGAMLRDPTAVFGRRREIVEDAVYMLETAPEELKVEGMFRTVGPAEVSLKHAPALVIQAICAAIVEDPKKADDAAKSILRTRAEMETTTDGAPVDASPTLISNALKDLNLSPQEQKEIAAMLTVKPTLYECVAETFDQSNTLVSRSGGFYLVGDANLQNAYKQRGAFLSWDQKALVESTGQ